MMRTALGLRLFLLVSMTGFLFADAEVIRHPCWTSALRPAGKPGPVLLLVENAASAYSILLPAEPTSMEQMAADELACWLKAMTQATLPVVREQKDVTVSGPVISVGQTRYWIASGLANGSLGLGDESYRLAVKGQDLFLLGGRTRGILNAVYAFLEEDLDCRWYAQNVQSIPHVNVLKCQPVSRSVAPAFDLRDPFYWDAFEEYWSLRNRTNSPWAPVRDAWGGSLRYPGGYFCHTFAKLVPAERYFKDHPEYFSEAGGKRNSHQLCLSHPEVLKIATANVREVAKTGCPLISVSPNDGAGGHCQCSQCKAVNAKEGSEGGTLLWFVNAIAEAVRKEYPKVRITTLAYLGTDIMPRKTQPAKNVIIIFCTDYDAWRWPMLPLTETVTSPTRLKGWARTGANIFIWDYTTNFSHHLVPMPNMNVVTENIRFYLKQGVKGVMLQGAYQGPGSDRGPMRCWVWAKQLWNPSLDTRALIRDFNYGYYGAAAEPLQQYDDLLWNLWEKTHDEFRREYREYKPSQEIQDNIYNIRYKPTVLFLDKEFLHQASKLFKRAEELAAGNDKLARRVALAKMPLLYTKLSQTSVSPSDDYIQLLAEFESTARREKITYLEEGPRPDVQEKIQAWRKSAMGDGTE